MNMKLLVVMLQDAMARKQYTARKAALEMGIAHNTLPRILKGETPSLDTFLKVCSWLSVAPSLVLDGEGEHPNKLAAQIAAILEAEPRLANTFSKALERVLEGRMSPQTFRELAAFAAYQMDKLSAEDEDNGATPTNPGGGE